MSKREKWIDIAKGFACVLIVIGHLLIGLQTAGILPKDGASSYFIKAMYFFHVQVFFLCSGYLHQARCKTGIAAHFINVLVKLVDLGVPFVVFSTVAWALKLLFEGAVNTEETGTLFERLFTAPAAPYWYLYIIFFIFIISPKITSNASALMLVAMSTMMAVLVSFFSGVEVPYAVEWTSKCWIWFVLGMICSYFDIFARKIKIYYVVPWFVFVPISVVVWIFSVDFPCLDIIMGVLGCGMTVFSAVYIGQLASRFDTSLIVRYTMPVFLMHTIASPAVRAFLIRLGVTNGAVHLIVGAAVGIIIPVVAGVVMRLLVIPDILMYPRQTVKRLKSFSKKSEKI